MRLELTANLEALSTIRDFVGTALRALDVDSSVHDDLCVAVDEAVTNILLHGYDGSGDIDLEMTVDNSDLVVEIRDKAPVSNVGASLAATPAISKTRDKPGGYGLYLIRSAMDEVLYESNDVGNELHMIKRGVVSK